MIEEASESGELTPLVLLVIRNRLELARHDVSLFSYNIMYSLKVFPFRHLCSWSFAILVSSIT